MSEPEGLHGDPRESGSSRRKSKTKSCHTEGGGAEPSAATQLCKEMDVTAQEHQPSENGSENRGRAGLAPSPSAMFDFRFQQKKNKPPPGKSSGRTQTSSSQLRGRAVLPGPSCPVTAVPSSPRSFGTPPRRFAPARHPRKGAAPALGRCKPSPEPHSQPLSCSGCAAPGRGGTRHPAGMAMSHLCRLSPLAFAQQSPRSRAQAGGEGAGARQEFWSWH